MVKKNIFRQPLESIEGHQDFSPIKSQERINHLPKSKRKRFCVVKEKRPKFLSKSEWKQIYSIQRRDKMKAIGEKCHK